MRMHCSKLPFLALLGIAMSGCASDPLSMIPPAERAMIMAEAQKGGRNGGRSISVDQLLAHARGESAEQAARAPGAAAKAAPSAAVGAGRGDDPRRQNAAIDPRGLPADGPITVDQLLRAAQAYKLRGDVGGAGHETPRATPVPRVDAAPLGARSPIAAPALQPEPVTAVEIRFPAGELAAGPRDADKLRALADLLATARGTRVRVVAVAEARKEPGEAVLAVAMARKRAAWVVEKLPAQLASVTVDVEQGAEAGRVIVKLEQPR